MSSRQAPLDLGGATIFLTLAGSHAHGTAGPESDVDLRGVAIVPLRLRVALFERFEQLETKVLGPITAPAQTGTTARQGAGDTSVDASGESGGGGAAASSSVTAGACAASFDRWLRSHLERAGEGATLDPAIRQILASLGRRGQPAECVVYDVAKFLQLCATANPNALEVLFADPRDWLLGTPAWALLHRHRHRFLTRQVRQTYLGYAMAQLQRIRTHRAWLLEPPRHKPTRTEFGLPDVATLSRDDRDRLEETIAEKLRAYGVDDVEMPKATRLAVQERLRTLWLDALAPDTASTADIEERGDPSESRREVATRALRLPPAVVAALSAERRYRAAMKHWTAYETWKAQRNPARAALEARHGYDTKHAAHLVRLLRSGLEILSTADLAVRRPDAAELVAVRAGSLSYDELLELAARIEAQIAGAAAASRLPAEIDRGFVEELAIELIREFGQPLP